MKIKLDCRHFPGDRPCVYHKTEGTSCPTCSHYEERGTSILIIKFEALGDVLRTTSLLPSLKREYGTIYVTWITTQEALPLFVGNPYVDEILSEPQLYMATLLAREFDIVVNPDTCSRSCHLASIASAETKFGFVASPRGAPVPLGDAALRWLEMGGNDEIKRANTRTYQEIIHEMCNLDPSHQNIVIGLTDAERAQQSEIAHKLNLEPSLPVVGINTGAGRRWELKKWTVEGFVNLIDMMQKQLSAQVLLFGGPDDYQRNFLIAHTTKRQPLLWQASCLRELFQVIDLCDVVVSGDTLVAHASVGLGKRTVVLFGPTSPAEFDLYGLGEKIVAPLDCISCYSQKCERKPNCMESIESQMVLDAVRRQLREVARIQETILVGEPGS